MSSPSQLELRFAGTPDELARWARLLDEDELLLVLSAPAEEREALWQQWRDAFEHAAETTISRALNAGDREWTQSGGERDTLARESFVAWLAETIFREASEGSPERSWRANEDQALRNAYQRARFLTDYSHVSSETVRKWAKSAAREHPGAEEWRRRGDAFAVKWHAELLYPSFQFADAAPKPIIRDVIAPFRARGASEWELALWFAGPNPWLRRPPAWLVDEDPQAVAVAAGRAFEVLG